MRLRRLPRPTVSPPRKTADPRPTISLENRSGRPRDGTSNLRDRRHSPSLHATRRAIHSTQKLLQAIPAELAAFARLLFERLRFRADISRAQPDREARDRHRLKLSCASANRPALTPAGSQNYPDAVSNS